MYSEFDCRHLLLPPTRILLLLSQLKYLYIIPFSGDLTDLQIVALRWRALAQQAKDESIAIHFKILFEALRDLDQQWDQDLLSNEEVRFLFLLFQKKKVHLTKNFKCCVALPGFSTLFDG